jgi:hypothetical protein
LLFAAAAASGLPAAAAPGDALDRFAGTWQSTGTFVDSPFQKAGSVSGTTTCAWSADRVFMICQQDATMNGVRDPDIGIYTYDSAAKAYRFYAIRPGRTNAINITVDANTITYPVTFTDAGKNVTIRTLNVWDNASSYRWRTEYSNDDGKTWRLIGSGISNRITP